jgi:hypothetical protein
LIGASFSLTTMSSAALVVAGFGRDLAAAVLTGAALGTGFWGFTVTFDVAMGVGLAGGRAAFFAADTFNLTFPGFAFPGFLAALFGFFEGITVSAS